MPVWLEVVGGRELLEVSLYGAFEGGVRCDVDDVATAGADEVVMVLSQRFIEFEAGVLVASRDPTDHTGGLQVD